MPFSDPAKEPFSAPFIAPDGAVPNSFTAAKRFTLEKRPVRAVLRATALGLYEASLNGSKVGEDHLAPFWTAYTHTLHYQTYDVTALLNE